MTAGEAHLTPTSVESDADLDVDPRLEGDRQLWDQLAAVGFSGPCYEVFVDELFRYSFPIICAWVRTGEIFTKARQRGARGVRRTAVADAEVEDFAQEIFVKALTSFREHALVEGRWDPSLGASLKTYFIGSCLFALAGVSRSWHRRQNKLRKAQDAAEDLYRSADPQGADPADMVILRRELDELLSSMPRNEIVVRLKEAGLSHDAIAEALETTKRAVDGILYRHRRAERERNQRDDIQ